MFESMLLRPEISSRLVQDPRDLPNLSGDRGRGAGGRAAEEGGEAGAGELPTAYYISEYAPGLVRSPKPGAAISRTLSRPLAAAEISRVLRPFRGMNEF